ncbi:MAG: STAS domain-containing protein [Sporichthyaceae bacterium]|nr:STAS domain-containing protein [Sporichthyaceae bacterium]
MISLLDPNSVGSYTVVGVTGEVDVATAPSLRDSVLSLLNRGTDKLVLDLRGVTFMDSTGVGSLLRIHHRAGLLGTTVHFVADQPAVLRVLDLMQLRQRLHITPTVAAVGDCCDPSSAKRIDLSSAALR